MAARVLEVLVVDAVFVDLELLRNAAEVAAASNMCGTDLVPDGLFIGGLIGSSPHFAPVQGRVLRLPRDRLTVEAASARTRVSREYPEDVKDVSLVAQLAKQAIAATDLHGKVPSSYGFNIQMVYDQDSGEDALRYLGRRLFHPEGSLDERWEPSGGFGRMVFREGDWTWRVGLEPRLQATDTTKVYLDLNLNIPEARLPETDDVTALMREQWYRAHALIETIDGMVDG